MCNIVTELVTEFYLYSIVYIYLINSRLDVTHSVCHHFRTLKILSWCQKCVATLLDYKKLHTCVQHCNRTCNRILLDYKKLYTCVQHCNRTCNRILLVQYSIHIYIYTQCSSSFSYITNFIMVSEVCNNSTRLQEALHMCATL